MNIESVFAALASTPRRKILAYLSEASLTAGEIAERFDMTKPSMSKHLKILEHAGLIRGDKQGQFVHYRLADDNMLGTLHNYLATFCPVGGPLKKESAAIRKAGTAPRKTSPSAATTSARKAAPLKTARRASR